jgi:hypothetical protein
MSDDDDRERCDTCGSTRLVWRKCKQICLDCGAINRSCADLAESAR